MPATLSGCPPLILYNTLTTSRTQPTYGPFLDILFYRYLRWTTEGGSGTFLPYPQYTSHKTLTPKTLAMHSCILWFLVRLHGVISLPPQSQKWSNISDFARSVRVRGVTFTGKIRCFKYSKQTRELLPRKI